MVDRIAVSAPRLRLVVPFNHISPSVVKAPIPNVTPSKGFLSLCPQIKLGIRWFRYFSTITFSYKMPPPDPLPTYIYKILRAPPPSFSPSPLPLILPLFPFNANDGFIHLSTAAQTAATTARFFADCDTLYIHPIPLKRLEEGSGELKWEESIGHGVFSHLLVGDWEWRG